jgi:excisionase family DNA binding protein
LRRSNLPAQLWFRSFVIAREGHKNPLLVATAFLFDNQTLSRSRWQAFPMSINSFREFLLDRIDQLDQLYDSTPPHAVLEAGARYAKAADDAGNMAARLGFADLHQRSREFGQYAEWGDVKTFLSQCLASVPLPAEPARAAATLSVEDVAELLGCDKRTVWRRRNEGSLPPPIKLGRLVRWNKAEFEKWLASN